MNRRDFLMSSLAACSFSGVAAAAAPADSLKSRNKIIGFTKSFADLSLADSAALVEEIGWDGVDVTIRSSSTHIQPQKVADDLPAFIELLKKRDKVVSVVTTDIWKITSDAEKLLRVLADSGVKKYRLGFLQYQKNDPPMMVAREAAPMLKDIASLNKELGLWAGYQNHSGPSFFGGPLWDVMTAMEGTAPEQLGLCFDIAHATVEGGQNWPIQYRLARPRIGVSYVKDYRWREAQHTWHRDSCHFGQGVVRKEFFTGLLASGFEGEFCQHHEYPLGSSAERIDHYKRDLKQLRSWLG